MTTKLILSALAMACGIVAAVFGAKSYIISLKNGLRLKYNQITSANERVRLELMQKEYEHKLCLTITVCIVTFLVLTYAAYVTVLCLKNNVSLI